MATQRRSNAYPFDLIQGDFITGAVVELGRTRGLVRGDGLRVFQRPAVKQKGRDARGPEGVIANAGRQTDGTGPALDHAQRIRAMKAARGK